ncbi:MAG: hypothetical protein LBC97_13165 [Bifidobacteriaceae bacterium]|jgi:hypothetical protein|nr:hypothetical protein [Bifidobacteriaceae bacterium]
MRLPEYTAAQEARIREWERDREDSIAGCMRERGFDYFPGDWEPEEAGASMLFFVDGVDVIAVNGLPNDLARVRAEGYGLRAPAGGTESGGEALPGAQANEEYRESLSADSREAYDLAMGGQDVYEEPDPSALPGCLTLANERHPEPELGDLSVARQFWVDFGPLVLGMNRVALEDVFNDQRVRDLSLEWYSCMVKAGYSELAEGGYYSVDNIDLNAGYSLALATKADGEVGDSWYNFGISDTPDDERSLVGSPAEIAIAVADFQCREPLNYFETHRAVQLELEQAYVDQNSAAFDKLTAFYDRYKAGDLS